MAALPVISGDNLTGRRDDVEEVLEGGDGEPASALAMKGEKDDRGALLLFSVNASSALGCDASIPLTEKEKFAIACWRKLMRSWVSQPSPCCAAASVAGALNALSTKEEPDWTCAQPLEYYKVMTRDRISRQKRLLQLQTGVSEQELADLEAAIGEQLAASGELAFGGMKKISRKQMLNAVSACLRADPSHFSVFGSVLTLNEPESLQLEFVTSGRIGDAPDTSESARTSTSAAFEIAFRNSAGTHPHREKQLQDTLYQYLHLLDGLAKLERPEKPSTAICGNEAILRVIEAINANESDMDRLGLTDRKLKATLFMDKESSAERQRSSAPRSHQAARQISQADSKEQREEVWMGLWREFSRESTVLIYHLKNHYALVFAMREWQEPPMHSGEGDHVHSTPRQCREILTARRGQRPSTWISLDEVYATLCAWDGYKIISVSIE